MYFFHPTKSFRKSWKRLERSGDKKLVNEIKKVLALLVSGVTLEEKYQDHDLQGVYKGWRECHVSFDFLLIYRISKEQQAVIVHDIGSHSYLFGT